MILREQEDKSVGELDTLDIHLRARVSRRALVSRQGVIGRRRRARLRRGCAPAIEHAAPVHPPPKKSRLLPRTEGGPALPLAPPPERPRLRSIGWLVAVGGARRLTGLRRSPPGLVVHQESDGPVILNEVLPGDPRHVLGRYGKNVVHHRAQVFVAAGMLGDAVA